MFRKLFELKVCFFFLQPEINVSDIDEISKACHLEFQRVFEIKELQSVDNDSLLKFSDINLCKTIDAACPVLSNALKGAMGSKDRRREDGEPPANLAARTLCYGAIFKSRFVPNLFF